MTLQEIYEKHGLPFIARRQGASIEFTAETRIEGKRFEGITSYNGKSLKDSWYSLRDRWDFVGGALKVESITFSVKKEQGVCKCPLGFQGIHQNCVEGIQTGQKEAELTRMGAIK